MGATNEIRGTNITLKLADLNCSQCEEKFTEQEIAEENFNLWFDTSNDVELEKLSKGYCLSIWVKSIEHLDCQLETCEKCWEQFPSKLMKELEDNRYCPSCYYDEINFEILKLMNQENIKDFKKCSECSACNITEEYLPIEERNEEGFLLCEPCKLGEEIELKETELKRLVDRQRILFWRLRRKSISKLEQRIIDLERQNNDLDYLLNSGRNKYENQRNKRIKELEQKLKAYE